MTLMEFSMIPLDKGPSFSDYVARILTLVDQSGLDYRLNPMGTVVEGEWDDLMALLTRCFRALETGFQPHQSPGQIRLSKRNRAEDREQGQKCASQIRPGLEGLLITFQKFLP